MGALDVVQPLRIPVVKWVSMTDAVAHIEMAMGCDRPTALRQLRAAIPDSHLPVRWIDQEGEADVPPLNREFWNEASIRLDQGGLVLHQTLGVTIVNGPYSSGTDIPVLKAPPRWRGLIVDRQALHQAWPLPPDVEQLGADESRVPVKRAGKQAIREAARQLYAARPDDPPNMTEAEILIRRSVPGATRVPIRDVLREPEFAKLRRPSGVRRKRKPCEKVWAANLQAIDGKVP